MGFGESGGEGEGIRVENAGENGLEGNAIKGRRRSGEVGFAGEEAARRGPLPSASEEHEGAEEEGVNSW